MNWHNDAAIYREYLGIESVGDVPNHYQLLELAPFRVSESEVVQASTLQLQKLDRNRRDGDTPAYERLCREVKSARDCLADPDRKRAYDRSMQREMLMVGTTGSDSPQTRQESTPNSSASMQSPTGLGESANQEDKPRGGDAMNQQTPPIESSSKGASFEVNMSSGNELATLKSVERKQPTEASSREVPNEAPASEEANHPNYEILHEIGRGASSIVYEAYDRMLRRYVAIKELDERFHMNLSESELFWNEARFLADIQHENIVRVHGVDPQRRWIILELMQADLETKLTDGPMQPELVRSVLRQVLQGLRFLHHQNKLHGEVKLGNMLVDDHGRVKLSDSPGVSLDGEFRLPAGSQRHVAPELLKPETFGPVGPGVDLYSLGFAAIELLVGQRFQEHFPGVNGSGEKLNLAWLRWHGSNTEQVPSVQDMAPHVPEDLAAVIDGLTRKHPDERYRSASEALNDLADKDIVLLNLEEKKSNRSFLNAVAKSASNPENNGCFDSFEHSNASDESVRSRKVWLWGLGAVPVLMFLILISAMGNKSPAKKEPQEPNPVDSPSLTTVKIIVDPRSSTVSVGGFDPQHYAFEPGVYELVVSCDGYETHKSEISVSGQTFIHEVTLETVNEEESPTRVHRVIFEPIPSNAKVLIEGAQASQANVFDLAPGEWKGEASADGYITKPLRFTIDQDVKKLIVLEKAVDEAVKPARKPMPEQRRTKPTYPTQQRNRTDEELLELSRGDTGPIVSGFRKPLTDRQEQFLVSSIERMLFDETLTSKNWIAGYQSMKNVSNDPRIDLAIAFRYLQSHEYDLALMHFSRSRSTKLAIPFFAAWRESILLRMKRRRAADIDAAIVELQDLIEQIVKWSEYDRLQSNQSERFIARNIYFVGRVFGLLQQFSETDTRVLVGNVDDQVHSARARLEHSTAKISDFARLLELGRMDVRPRFIRERRHEQKVRDENRKEAERTRKVVTQAEKEMRATMGKHEPGPNGFDYFEESGSIGATRDYLPSDYHSIVTADRKTNKEVYRERATIFRRPQTLSKRIATYLTTNIHLQKTRLLQTLPKKTQERRSFGSDEEHKYVSTTQ